MLPELPTSYPASGYPCRFCGEPMQTLFRLLCQPDSQFDDAAVLLLHCLHHEAKLVLVQSERRGSMDGDSETIDVREYPLSRRGMFSLMRRALRCPDLEHESCLCVAHLALSPQSLRMGNTSILPPEDDYPMAAHDVRQQKWMMPRIVLSPSQTLAQAFPRLSAEAREAVRLMHWIRNGDYPDVVFSYDEVAPFQLEGSFSEGELSDMGCSLGVINELAVRPFDESTV